MSVVPLLRQLSGRHQIDGRQVPGAGAERVPVIDPATELAGLQQSIIRLENEVRELHLTSERLDAEQRLTQVLEKYQRW